MALRAAAVIAVAATATAVTLAVTLGLPSEHRVGAPGATPSEAPSHPAGGGGSASCLPANLAVSADPWGGAAGSRGTTVLFRTVDSAGSCTLQGTPRAELVDAAGHLLVSAAADRSAGSPIELGAGRVAELNVHWSNWCAGDGAMELKLVLHLGGPPLEIQATALGGGQTISPPLCNGAGQPSTLGLVPFELSARAFPPG